MVAAGITAVEVTTAEADITAGAATLDMATRAGDMFLTGPAGSHVVLSAAAPTGARVGSMEGEAASTVEAAVVGLTAVEATAADIDKFESA